MKDYPLGSFPRFPWQEQAAKERRARALHNSFVTRHNKKLIRMENETVRMHQICNIWNDVINLIKKVNPDSIPIEIGKLLLSTDRRIRRLAENWNPDITKSAQMQKFEKDIIDFKILWNSHFSKQN